MAKEEYDHHLRDAGQGDLRTRTFVHRLSNSGGQQTNNFGNTNHLHVSQINYQDGSEEEWKKQREEKRKEKANLFLRDLYTCKYENRKDINATQVVGTCAWFLSHQLFRHWKGDKSSRTLWVSADPGCGKSVLAKHLIDSVLGKDESTAVCYFFFKDGSDDQVSISSAFCCILRQLFIQREDLLPDSFLELFERNGQKLMSSFRALWGMLVSIAKDDMAGEIICLLDALDECQEQGRVEFTKELAELHRTKQVPNLKFLITSRPYDRIRRGFEPSVLRLSGESAEEMAKIIDEIDLVISYRVENLSKERGLTPGEKALLLGSLKSNPNRTYLWVHLTLDMIEKRVRISPMSIQQIATTLPSSVDEAYDKILTTINDAEKPLARKILHTILASTRPLSVKETAFAIGEVDGDGIHDLDSHHWGQLIRDLCGLLVTIIDSKVYLLHQTVREFLVGHGSLCISSDARHSLEWKHSFNAEDSNRLLAAVCMDCLLAANVIVKNGAYTSEHLFFSYASRHWPLHFRKRGLAADDDALLQKALMLCDAKSPQFLAWSEEHYRSPNDGQVPISFSEKATRCPFLIACIYGIDGVVKQLLETKGANCPVRKKPSGLEPLHCVAYHGYVEVVRLLLERPASPWSPSGLWRNRDMSFDVNSRSHNGSTPLMFACSRGHEAVIRLLLSRDELDINSQDKLGKSALMIAANTRNLSIVEILLSHQGLDLNAGDKYGQTAFMIAAGNGDLAIVEILLSQKKLDINVRNGRGETALMEAMTSHRDKVIQALVARTELDINSKDWSGETAFMKAAFGRDLPALEALLASGRVNVNAADHKGETALMKVAHDERFPGEGKFLTVARLILKLSDLEPDQRDRDGNTAIFHAARRDNGVMNLLLTSQRFNVTVKNHAGQTALMHAAIHDNIVAFKALLATGRFDLHESDHEGQPLLFHAALHSPPVAKLLLIREDMDLNERNVRGDFALIYILRSEVFYPRFSEPCRLNAEASFHAMVECCNAEQLNAQDQDGNTALIWAARRGLQTQIRILLRTRQVDIDIKNKRGETALSSVCDDWPIWDSMFGTEKAKVKKIIFQLLTRSQPEAEFI